MVHYNIWRTIEDLIEIKTIFVLAESSQIEMQMYNSSDRSKCMREHVVSLIYKIIVKRNGGNTFQFADSFVKWLLIE